MRLYAEQGLRGTVVDLDTGRRVPKVIWIDLDSMELEAFRVTDKGEFVRSPDGSYATYTAKGKFRLDPVTPRAIPKVKEGARCCEICKHPLTLPGSELCVRCNSAKRRNGRLAQAVPPHDALTRCQHKGCARMADWVVADEVDISPLRKKGLWWSRGATVARRYYCHWHYSPPRLLDQDGEPVGVLEDLGVRPD